MFEGRKLPNFRDALRLAGELKHSPTPELQAEQKGDVVVFGDPSGMAPRMTQDWAKRNRQRYLNFCDTGEWK